MTSGQQANRTGGQLEHFIEDALIRRGYSEFWNHKAQAFANRAAIGVNHQAAWQSLADAAAASRALGGGE